MVTTDFPLHRLRQFGCLSEADIVRFRDLGGPLERFARRAVIRHEGATDRSLFLLVDGWVAASELMRGGHRQITKLHLPGDLLGGASLAFGTTVETLTTLTPAAVRRIRPHDLGSALTQSNQIAIWMMLCAQAERAALMDRLTAVGRADSAGRLAGTLLDLRERLAVIHGPSDVIELPVTQEELGDYLGLTSVHVNRTLRGMTAAGLITRSGLEFRLEDIDGLKRLAAMTIRRPANEIDWLRAP